ncbi:MAG: diadenylate cyclase [Byssovorax sp.]
MGKTISLFIWGYQGHFRINLETRAKGVLQEIASTLEPDALLVGIRVPEKTHGAPVCLEPEDEDWDPALFANCARRTEEIYEKHEDHNVLYGDEARTRDQPENIRKSSVLRAVRETFESYDHSNGTRTFCAWPERIGGYYVVCALQFNKAQFDEYPVLEEPIRYADYVSSGGFLNFVIDELLTEARRGLWGPDPGRFHDTLDTDREAIFRKAGDSFCSVLSLATKDLMFQRAFEKFNKISALLYEGTAGVGRLVVVAPDHEALVLQIEFSNTVPLEQSRWARKILEMGIGDLCCACSGAQGIRGLGTLTNADADGLFLIEFTGHFKWQLRHKGKILLQSAFGVPRLPRALLKEAIYKSTFRRLFDDVDQQDEERSWQIVQAAIKQQHGTMIVISENAEKEAARLKTQSTPISPVLLSAELVDRVSGIDGAILIDKHGTCMALGVILDGIAAEYGDPARGARFNSAIRYLGSQDDVATLVLVISEDGTVDMIPTLRQQIARSAIERRIARLRQCSFDNFHKTRNWLREQAFYLDAEQCKSVNEQVSRIEGAPRDARILHIETGTFEPHPDMDQSYYLPEPLK